MFYTEIEVAYDVFYHLLNWYLRNGLSRQCDKIIYAISHKYEKHEPQKEIKKLNCCSSSNRNSYSTALYQFRGSNSRFPFCRIISVIRNANELCKDKKMKTNFQSSHSANCVHLPFARLSDQTLCPLLYADDLCTR